MLRGGAEAPPGGAGGADGNPFAAGGMPGGFGGGGMPGMGGGRSFHFSTGGGGGGFSFSNPEDMFSSFFKNGGAGMDGEDDDIFASLGGGMGGSRRPSGFRSGSSRFGEGRTGRMRQPTPEVTTVERPLPLTLEEMFKGTHKKLKIKRKTYDDSGKRTTQDKILEMDIKPGLKKGSKIKFKGVGDQEEGGSQDLHFIVSEVSPLERLEPLCIY